MNLYFGQMLLMHRSIIGKPDAVYVATSQPNEDYLIKLCFKWPYISGEDHFFMHRDRLKRHYRDNKIGIQTELFI